MNPRDAVRDQLARVASSRPFDAVVRALERVDRRADALAVLTYHRVDDAAARPELSDSLLSASPATFASHIRDVVAGRPALALDDLLAVRRGERRVPRGAVMVTFDDAYRDFAEHAWPVLRAAGIPATVFVPTAFPDDRGRSFWWDRVHHAFVESDADVVPLPGGGGEPMPPRGERRAVFRRWRAHLKDLPHDEAMAAVDELVAALGAPAGDVNPVLGWDELRRLAAEGVALVPHSRTHPMLTQVDDERLRDELEGSRADLAAAVGAAPPAFAYPSGLYDDRVVAATGAAGYEVAFTTDRGVNDLRRPRWLRLRRINVGSRSSTPVIRAQVLPSLARLGGS